MTQPPHQNQSESVPAQLGLWDAVSIIVGIVVGVSIFRVPAMIFSNVEGPWQGMGVWAIGGLLSLVGALCYAELATTYPRSGGDYVYLTRAYGPLVGFLFGWAQLVAILTGSIGAMAYTFSDYAVTLFESDASLGVWLAVAAVLVLTLINLLGVVAGKTTQNLLTAAKVTGLVVIVAAGFLWGGSASLHASQPMEGPGLGLAMVFVLYAFGGWNDAAFVAAEVRNRQQNIPRALILGTSGITLIYLLTNAAYLFGLGFEGVRASAAPAADLLKNLIGEWGSTGMSLLVMISALGAINGLIFTGSRIYASLGNDYGLFAWLGRWHPRLGTPIWSLCTQSAVSVLLIAAVGTQFGRNAIDNVLIRIGLGSLPWQNYHGGFNTLVAATAPVFWFFFLLTGLSLFVLRVKDRHVRRPFSVPLFPIVPVVFCLTCTYMLFSSVMYARSLTLLGFVPVLLGLPLYVISRKNSSVGADQPV